MVEVYWKERDMCHFAVHDKQLGLIKEIHQRSHQAWWLTGLTICRCDGVCLCCLVSTALLLFEIDIGSLLTL